MMWLWFIVPAVAVLALLIGGALLWRLKLGTAAQWKSAADAARDWAAVLYTPILTVYAVWVTAVVVWFPWTEATEEQRITILGAALIGSLVLIGLGTLFYQRRSATVRGKTAAGEFEVTSSDGQLAGNINPATGAVAAAAGSAAAGPTVTASTTPPATAIPEAPPWERK